MSPKQEKFIIAKYQELSKTVAILNQERLDILAFLVPRGYKPQERLNA